MIHEDRQKLDSMLKEQYGLGLDKTAEILDSYKLELDRKFSGVQSSLEAFLSEEGPENLDKFKQSTKEVLEAVDKYLMEGEPLKYSNEVYRARKASRITVNSDKTKHQHYLHSILNTIRFEMEMIKTKCPSYTNHPKLFAKECNMGDKVKQLDENFTLVSKYLKGEDITDAINERIERDAEYNKKHFSEEKKDAGKINVLEKLYESLSDTVIKINHNATDEAVHKSFRDSLYILYDVPTLKVIKDIKSSFANPNIRQNIDNNTLQVVRTSYDDFFDAFERVKVNQYTSLNANNKGVAERLSQILPDLKILVDYFTMHLQPILENQKKADETKLG